MLRANYVEWRTARPAFSGNAIKRVSGKHKGLVGDSGLACWLQRISSPDALAASPLMGAMFETFVLNMLLAQWDAIAIPSRSWHWRTAGRAEVDRVIVYAGQESYRAGESFIAMPWNTQ